MVFIRTTPFVMQSIAAYLTVILMWSTAPLAIRLSNQSFTPITASTCRMILAALCGMAICALLGKMPQQRHWRPYLAGAAGLFPSMLLIYFAAQHISSGVIAVINGFSPFVTGIASALLLNSNPFTLERIIALLIALAGLVIVFADQLGWGQSAWLGLILMLGSSWIFAISTVVVKKLTRDSIDPLELTVGSLLLTVPGFLLAWVLFDRTVPSEPSAVSVGAVLYLALPGSLLGYIAYNWLLRHMPIGTVALIPLVTPVLALLAGHWVAGEPLSSRLFLGTGMIIAALALYERKRLWA